MSARRYKHRILELFHNRFYGQFMWQSAEDRAWENVAPVGREFGSPDFDRLCILDMFTRGDLSSDDAMLQLGVDRGGLMEMVKKDGLPLASPTPYRVPRDRRDLPIPPSDEA